MNNEKGNNYKEEETEEEIDYFGELEIFEEENDEEEKDYFEELGVTKEDDIESLFQSLEDVSEEEESDISFKEHTMEEIIEGETIKWESEKEEYYGQMEKYDIDDPEPWELKSTEADLLGGVEEVRQRTGRDLDDDWEQTAGEEILYAEGDEENIGEITYPLLLTQITTEEMFNRVQQLITEQTYGEEVTFMTQVGDVAVTMGKGKLNFPFHERLSILGLNPTYFESQGNVKPYEAIEFFDASIYDPLILMPEEKEEEEEGLILPDFKEEKEKEEPKTLQEEADSGEIPDILLTEEELEKKKEERELNELLDFLGDTAGEVFDEDELVELSWEETPIDNEEEKEEVGIEDEKEDDVLSLEWEEGLEIPTGIDIEY